MCGRFVFDPTTNFYERFRIRNRVSELTPRYNVAPGQLMPIVIRKSPNQVMLMKWGLIPHWAKDEKIGYKMINARLETLGEKPSFKNSLKTKRCLVPASGFYEWKSSKKNKIPYYIHIAHEPLFAFAGLYDVWRNQNDEDVYSFTIITRDATLQMAAIHDRMPVILEHGSEDKWLKPELTDSGEILNLLNLRQENDALEIYEVSTLVNKPQNDSKDLVQPVDK